MKRLWGTVPRVKTGPSLRIPTAPQLSARHIHQHTFYPVSTDREFAQLDVQKPPSPDLWSSSPSYLPPEACGLKQLAPGDFVEAIVAGKPYWGIITQRQPFTLHILDSDGIKREVPVDCVTFGLYGFAKDLEATEYHARLTTFLSSVSHYYRVAVRKLSTIHSLMAKQTIPWSIALDEATDTLVKMSPPRRSYSWSAAALAIHITFVNSPRHFRCDYAQTADYDSWSPLNYVALPIDTVEKIERVVLPDTAARSVREFRAIANRYLASTENTQHRHLPVRALFTGKQPYDTWDAVVVFLRHYVEYPHGNLKWVVPEIVGSWLSQQPNDTRDPFEPSVVRDFLHRINESTPSGPGSVFLAGSNDIAFSRHRLAPGTVSQAGEAELADGNSMFYEYCSQKYQQSERYESEAAAQFLHKWADKGQLLDRHFGFGIVEQEGEPAFLHLHVPDLTQTVPVNSSVMSVIGQRSYSMDTVEGRLDMLPEHVIDNLVLDQEPQRVMTVTVRLEDGKIPEDISPESVFVSFGTMEFEEAQTGASHHLLALLHDHYNYRLSKGALPGFAQSNKLANVVYRTGEVADLPRSIFLSSRQKSEDEQIAPRDEHVSLLHATEDLDVISEAQILINRLGAIFAAENGLDVLYRQQNDPLHAQKSDHPLNRKIQSLYFEKEHVSDEPGHHESLGLDGVIKIASPVTSLEDIVNQYQLFSKFSRACALRFHGQEVVDFATLRNSPKNDWLAPEGKEEVTPISERWKKIQVDVTEILEGQKPQMILELPRALTKKQLTDIYTQYLRPRQRLTDRTTQLVDRFWKITWLETQENFAYKCVVTRPALTYRRDPVTRLSTRARAYCIDLDMEVEVEVGDLQLDRGDRLVSMGVEKANRFTGELVLRV